MPPQGLASNNARQYMIFEPELFKTVEVPELFRVKLGRIMEPVKLVDLGNPEIGLAANQATTSGIAGPQVYVDTTETTTVPPGWHMITVQSTTPFGTSDWELGDWVGHLISRAPDANRPGDRTELAVAQV